MKYNTITKQVSETVPGGIYEQIDYHGEPPADVAARAGWVDVTPEIQLLIDAAKAEQDAANAAALAEADAKWKAEEDKRIMALPSIAAIIAENAALKVAAKEQAIRQAAELATLQAALDKAKDVASVAVAVKTWAIAEKGEKDSAASAAVDPEKPK
jgi:L-arabinose isomerase